MVQRWQECYSGCDLNNLFNNRQDLKELLKSHPSSEVKIKNSPKIFYSLFYFLLKNCEGLIKEVKKEFDLERSLSAVKLREVSGKNI